MFCLAHPVFCMVEWFVVEASESGDMLYERQRTVKTERERAAGIKSQLRKPAGIPRRTDNYEDRRPSCCYRLPPSYSAAAVDTNPAFTV